MAQQVALELEHLHDKSDDLEKYIGLAALQDRNETLFYRLLTDHLEELAPIVYTPTVGDACRRFSHVVRRTRGLWITPDDVDRIPELLANAQRPGVRLIVATDNERILGLGDQGAGGMGIPIGKLALYTAGAGIHPEPDAAGVARLRHRQRGAARRSALPRLPEAPAARRGVRRVHRGVRHGGHGVLSRRASCSGRTSSSTTRSACCDRYRHRLPSFNDDIQGTAAVVARRHPRRAARARRTAARPAPRAPRRGRGRARHRPASWRARCGAKAPTPTRSGTRIVLLDSQGLVFEGRDGVDDDKREFALPARLSWPGYGLTPSPATATTWRPWCAHVAPTILIGTTGTAGRVHRRRDPRDGGPGAGADRPAAVQPDREVRGAPGRRAAPGATAGPSWRRAARSTRSTSAAGPT